MSRKSFIRHGPTRHDVGTGFAVRIGVRLVHNVTGSADTRRSRHWRHNGKHETKKGESIRFSFATSVDARHYPRDIQEIFVQQKLAHTRIGIESFW